MKQTNQTDGKEQKQKMVDKKNIDAWSSALLAPPPLPEGPVDIAWNLARAGVEEGANRYGLSIFTTVEPEFGRFRVNIRYLEIESQYIQTIVFTYEQLIQGEGNNELLEIEVDKFLRKVAGWRDRR